MAAFTLIVALIVMYFLYELWRILYNAYFHPLAKFPGPWWAGASPLYEAYFDIVKGGRYFAEVEAMHSRYGPIVRVTPTELSIYDAEFYEKIYGGTADRRDIDPSLANLSTCRTSVISTVDHDHHRVRRIPLLNFFSKQAVTRLEPFVWSKVSTLVNKLKHAHKSGKVIRTMDVYGSLTTDVISHYGYGESFNQLGKDDDDEFDPHFLRAVSGLLFASHITLHFPLLGDFIRSLPTRLVEFTSQGFAGANHLRRWCADCGTKALLSMQPGAKEPSLKPNTIFEALLSPTMAPEERTLERLTDEGVVIMSAGLETTARFLTNITCHLLLNPDILSRLRTELKAAMPVPDACPSWSVLEKMPYMSAVISEGLRCEKTMANRFSRVILEPLPYKDWVIPANTSIGCYPYLQNNHADVFPEPEKFRPERWIEAREQGVNLNKYLGTFTKGGRMCIGINLAYAELFLTVAAIFRNFDMELVDSGLENIIAYRAYTLGFTKDYDFGIKVRITKVLEE